METTERTYTLRAGMIGRIISLFVGAWAVLALTSCGEATINPADPGTGPIDSDNPFAAILDKQWRLALLIPDDAGWMTPPAGYVYTVEFINDSSCRGTAACRLFTAPYTAAETNREVDLIEPQHGGERCNDGLADTYLEMLTRATNFRLGDDELELYYNEDPGVERTLVFREAGDQLFRRKIVTLNGGTEVLGENSSEFELTDVRVEDQTLVVSVTYNGICEEHEFYVNQGPIVQLSTDELFLQVTKNQVFDACDSPVSTDVRFSLETIRLSLRGFDGVESPETINLVVSGGNPKNSFTVEYTLD